MELQRVAFSETMGNFGPPLSQRLLASISRDDQLARIILQSMRVALPGIVKAFYPGPPATVDVLIATNEYVQMLESSATGFQTTDANHQPITVSNPSAGVFSVVTRALALPVLTKIPLGFYAGGGFSLTLPIQQGDEVLVLFTDTDPSVWFQNGGSGNNPPLTEQRHGLTNAIAYPCLRSTPRGIANYSTTSVQLRSDDGQTVIDLKSGQITITATNLTINSNSGTTQVNATTVNLTATGTVQIDGSPVNLDAGSGTVNIGGGNIVIGPSTTVDGHNFLTHVHSGVSTGGGTSGPVA